MTFPLDRTDRSLISPRSPRPRRRARCTGGITRTHLSLPVPAPVPFEEDPRDIEEAEAVIRQQRIESATRTFTPSAGESVKDVAAITSDPVALEHGLGASDYPTRIPPSRGCRVRAGREVSA